MLNWWLERNMLVCFFRLLTENGFGFAFITKFSKIVVWTSPGAFDVLKVDVLTMLTSPGAFEILCQVFQNELWRIFLLPCTKVVQFAVFFRENQFINPFKIDVEKMNCAGSSHCQRIGWSLTMKRKFSETSEIFKSLGMIETLFTNLWNCGCCLRWRWWWWIRKFPSKWKTCSWYWLLKSFRRCYEGPLTEVLLKIQWMIEKLIQDNVVVLRTIHSFCQKIKFVLLRDEVECKCWICLRGNC